MLSCGLLAPPIRHTNALLEIFARPSFSDKTSFPDIVVSSYEAKLEATLSQKVGISKPEPYPMPWQGAFSGDIHNISGLAVFSHFDALLALLILHVYYMC